ncbi:MAG: long-chain-fatty-acid--CoA ligase [Gammaproteobacteria bacterium]|jgi:fatty-acyl-CoA synthase|nr:long-chain-fatty-acid--CoA ligase [Gammaproteobacteria bacterium]
MTIEYDQLEPNDANFVALTPLSFLQRSADIYPQREALIYNQRRYNWAQVRSRCNRIASSLAARGIGKNDTVSVFAFNTPEMFESHFSIPMAGAVLNTINTRLDADTVAYIIDHAESRMFICDRQLWPVLEDALKSCSRQPEIVIIDDVDAIEKPPLPSDIEFSFYEDLVDRGDDTFAWRPPESEWQALTLNYTSGTTGRPKGVVYHHRGSYLMTMGTVVSWALPPHPRYLYTVPMFHCNGWGHAWTMTALAATVVCIRAFAPKLFFDLVEEHEVTHFGGAPIVLNMLALAPPEVQKKFRHTVHAMTAGAPPPARVLESMAQFNLEVMHVYGLTETYGHILHSAPQDDWQQQSIARQAELKARQGVRFAMTESVDVVDPESGRPVPWDAETMGEIVIRGNTVMKGYLKDPAATAEVFAGGYFRSGDIAVVFPDGYIQVKDRAKDVIISGGENISSVEVEGVLYRHPAVGDAAVVALADDKWGEVPCAFVELKPGAKTSEQQLIDFCADNMARFKRPKKVVFGELPKTATGKIQKNVLRERAKQL